ncbi:ABC transporter permease [Candidatus Pelagibacter sp.]|nr:ABC transporter permease [Candidatus Pelagibacter sp.]MDA9172220.1 ABC transporter permease [Candidatus Pelagibacter sp.]MDA9978360.1 ABC transporter permease [Candidatus Pelagibacter sp.]MDB2678586.1 ABC transporter permease [Candidatus Pelagibacter bacterium]MDB4065919.1 ABC transporter permease [Candidatus Pelagibacter sp.]
MEKLNNPSELNLIFRYALKDLSRNYKKLSSIIVTLFISLFILSAIFTIEDSLKKELNDNAKALLGGDLEIDYNRNKGNLELVDKVKEFATISQMIEFSTMVSTTNREKNKSLFTRIKTVDTKYPLYGDVNYEPAGAFDRMHIEPNTLLINESLSKNLNLKINEKIKVQNQLFTIIGIVKSVPDVSGFVAFGDWALAGEQTLEILKLNGIGSFLNYEYKVKFDPTADADKLEKKIENIFKDDQKVKLRYPENSASGLKRIINNFSQFLSLVSISAMLIAGIGIANTLLSFINQNNMSIAVRKAVGFYSGNIKTLYYLQLLILLLVITTFAYGSSFLIVPVVDQYLSDGLGLNVSPVFSVLNFIKIFLVGLLVLVIFSIPTISSIDQVKASNLFRNVFQNLEFYYSKKSITLSLILLSILVLLFSFGSERPIYSLGYFVAFFVCLIVFFLLSKIIIYFLKKFKSTSNISLKVSIKNITQTKSITPITIMSLGLGVTLLLTLALVGTNFQREIAKSIPDIAPDYFFVGIQKGEKKIFEENILKMDANAKIEVVPMVSSGIIKINGVNPNTYIKPDNDSYWVIGSDRRSSWVDDIPEDNPLTDGVWWDLTKPDKLQISLDAEVAKNLNIKLGDVFTLNIYGREIDGEIVNFRAVDYRDLSINFAMLFNPQFANNIPHEYLATAKFEMIDKFDETSMLEVLPSLSMIKIADYLNKVTDVLNKVFIAVTLISAVTIIIGLIVISSAIMVQGKIKEYQNLVFKILGFSKKEVILSSLIEFVIIFKSVILIAIIFAVIASKFIMENIFELVWAFDFKVLIYLSLSIGTVTLLLIMLTNLKYLNPKVYPLIRNQ